jgi:O-methyltransferase
MSAKESWETISTTPGDPTMAVASLQEVRSNMASTGIATERVHYVSGPVEETIPRSVPERIALLRLDTDWYESTRHELEHLWDRLEPGGVLIVDDYGHWAGAREAVDEFFAAREDAPLLSRVDYTGRMGVKHG